MTQLDHLREPPHETLGFAGRLFVALNAIIAFGALAVVAFVVDLGVYRWILNLGFFAPVLVFGSLVLGMLFVWAVSDEKVARVMPDVVADRVPVTLLGRKLAYVWVLAIVVFFGGLLFRALGDAGSYNGHNCWRFRVSEQSGETIGIYECAPGSKPGGQGVSYDPNRDSGGYYLCNYLNTSSSGGTIWRCRSGQY